MNSEQLNNLESLEEKQLVLRISGTVEQSNLAEFEQQALSVISGINTELETDEQFAEAESNVKSCQLMETRVANARSSALANTKAIADLIQTTERLEARFRETRLLLNGKVKTEKERRKNEIINGAKNRLAGMLINSSVKHGFVVNHTGIIDATKGKHSITKMQESVDEVVESEELRLANMEADYAINIEKIESSEIEWPGLFPDKRNLALSATETVDAIIQGRISEHRFKAAEIARLAEEKKRFEDEEKLKPVEETPIITEPEKDAWTPSDLPLPADPFIDLPYPNNNKYQITVVTVSDGASPAMMSDILTSLHGVIEVTVVKL